MDVKPSIKKHFNNKKITVLGLGLLGGGFNVVKFLAEQGTDITVTDLKTEKQLKTVIKKLQKFKNIKFVLGKHRLQDFKNRDLIIKASGVPLDSIYIKEAKKNKIPIEMDEALFVKLARKFFKDITVIGVTGTRGKSTTTHLLFEIIKATGKDVFLGGNVRGLATLPLLNKIKDGSIIVMELASWNLQGFGYDKISPNIAIFITFFDDHLNYYNGDRKLYFKDKSNIFKYQKKNDFLIMPMKTKNIIAKYYDKKIFGQIRICRMPVFAPAFAKATADKPAGATAGRPVILSKNYGVAKWDIKIRGEHNLQNISLAIQVAKILGIKENVIKQTVENFRGVSGRLEFIKEIDGVKYYNDTTSTMPDSTIAALKSFDSDIILIAGGTDKNLDYKDLVKELRRRSKSVKYLILFQGTATEKIIAEFKKQNCQVNYKLVDNMKYAVHEAKSVAEKNDVVLLSPGAASFGIFKNEFDRGSKFIDELALSRTN